MFRVLIMISIILPMIGIEGCQTRSIRHELGYDSRNGEITRFECKTYENIDGASDSWARVLSRLIEGISFYTWGKKLFVDSVTSRQFEGVKRGDLVDSITQNGMSIAGKHYALEMQFCEKMLRIMRE